MSRQILFVGGPKHGEIIEIKDEPKFNYIEPAKEKFNYIEPAKEEEEDFTTYTVCQAGDGKFYAVFEPSDNDPSVRKTKTMRAILRSAMGE